MNYSMLKKVQYVLLILLMIGSTPKVSGQCEAFENFPEGVKKGRQMHVSYRDYIKVKEYDKALPIWTKLMKYAPAGSVLHYIDGIELQKYAMKDATDTEKETYVQKIVDLYEQRIQCFSEARKDELFVRENMAYDMYFLDYDATKTYQAFQKVMKMSGDKPAAYLLGYYADHAVRMFAIDLLEREEIIGLHNDLLQLTQLNIDRNEADKQEYEEAEKLIKEVFIDQEGHIFDCTYFVKQLKPVFYQSYDDLESCKKVVESLKSKSCTIEDPFIVEVNQRMKVIQDSLNYHNRTYFVRGNEAERAKDHPLAIDYYFKSIEKKETDVPLERVYYQIAQNYYALDQKPKAREFALEALEIRPNWGKPYILIGKLYAASSKECIGKFEGRATLWIAVDTWKKAKSIDDFVMNEADDLIKLYSKYFPEKENTFLQGFKDGQTYKVGCWIQKTTRIRTISKY